MNILLFAAAFLLSGSAGLAALLRSDTPLSWPRVLSAVLNSGLLGLAICLLWYTRYQAEENLFFLLGVCVLAGLGGAKTVEMVLALAERTLRRNDNGKDR